MRSARIVRAPAPWIIQWDDLPILGKQTGPMVTAKGWCHDDLIVLGNASVDPPKIRFGIRTN